MARKPPDWRQPSLFSSDPAKPPEPHDHTTPQPDGDDHAVQDDHLRTVATTATDPRTTPQGPEAADDPGDLRQGAEGRPRSLEGTAPANAAGQRPEPDRERGPGDSVQGTGGPFAVRVSSGRQRGESPRRGDVVP